MGETRTGKAQELCLYGIGFLSMPLQPVISLIVPLWAVHLHATAVQTGIAVAAGSLVPWLYSIPTGGLIDRLGARRMLLGGSWGTAIGFVLYPWFSNVWVLVVLQLITGLFCSLTWQASQTYATQAEKTFSRVGLVGRFSSAATLGTFVGPLAIGSLTAVGFAWGFFGVAGIAAALGLCTLPLPELLERTDRIRADMLRMRWADFADAFQLLRTPAMLMIMLGTFCRLSVISVRQSFYPVFLAQLHVNASQIGILVATASLASALSAVLTGQLRRRLGTPASLAAGLFLGNAGLAVTPLAHSMGALFFLAAVSGLGIGITFPLLLALLAEYTSREQRGMSVALRNAMNRGASVVVPLGFGVAIAEWGMRLSFYGVGVILAVMTVLLFSYHRHLESQDGAAERAAG